MLRQQVVILENIAEIPVSLRFIGTLAVAVDRNLPRGDGAVVKPVQTAEGI